MNQICEQHGQPFLTMCIDEKCNLESFSCMECYKQHKCPKFEISQGIEEFSQKLNVDVTKFDKIQIQFKQLDVDSFTSYIKLQKQKVQEDLNLVKIDILKKIDQLELKLMETLDEQQIFYQRNVQLLKNGLKETDKFKSLNKSPDIIKLKLSNQDPNTVIRKLKQELVRFHNHSNSGLLEQLKEQLIVIQSQTVYPPTYRSNEFLKNENSRLSWQLEHHLLDIQKSILSYVKPFPITDLEHKNTQSIQTKKQTKLFEEDNCITSFLIIGDNSLIYVLNDMNVKFKSFLLQDLETIQCETQINCIIEVDIPFSKDIQYQTIGKGHEIQLTKQLALGGDDSILIWSVIDDQLCLIKTLTHNKLNRCLCLLQSDQSLIAGDWEGNLIIWNTINLQKVYFVETQSTIVFQLAKSFKYLISGSKCDMELGGIIFWNLTNSDCYQYKRLKLMQIQNMHVNDETLYVVDQKYKMYIYECDQIQLIKTFLCSESFVNEISVDSAKAIYILNSSVLKIITDQNQKVFFYDDFPCATCRQYYQSKRIHTNNGVVAFIRHVHQCRHESSDEDKCQMKSNFYLIY